MNSLDIWEDVTLAGSKVFYFETLSGLKIGDFVQCFSGDNTDFKIGKVYKVILIAEPHELPLVRNNEDTISPAYKKIFKKLDNTLDYIFKEN